jgi:hypothetical protein
MLSMGLLCGTGCSSCRPLDHNRKSTHKYCVQDNRSTMFWTLPKLSQQSPRCAQPVRSYSAKGQFSNNGRKQRKFPDLAPRRAIKKTKLRIFKLKHACEYCKHRWVYEQHASQSDFLELQDPCQQLSWCSRNISAPGLHKVSNIPCCRCCQTNCVTEEAPRGIVHRRTNGEALESWSCGQGVVNNHCRQTAHCTGCCSSYCHVPQDAFQFHTLP